MHAVLNWRTVPLLYTSQFPRIINPTFVTLHFPVAVASAAFRCVEIIWWVNEGENIHALDFLPYPNRIVQRRPRRDAVQQKSLSWIRYSTSIRRDESATSSLWKQFRKPELRLKLKTVMMMAQTQGSELSGENEPFVSRLQNLKSKTIFLLQIHAGSKQRTNNAWVPRANDRFSVAPLERFVEGDARATMFPPGGCRALFKSYTRRRYAGPNGIGLDCTWTRKSRCIEQRADIGRTRTRNGPIGGQRAQIP